MDLQRIDKELVLLETKKNMQYHIANSFIEAPWGFASKSPIVGKIFFALISMIDFSCDYSDKDLKFNFDDVADLVGIGTHGKERYALFKDALKSLNAQQVVFDIEGYIVNDNNEKVKKELSGACNWISEYVISESTREAVVRLPRLLSPILLNIKNFAFHGSVQKVFNTLAPFRSQYFIHLYLLIEEKAKYGTEKGKHWKPSLEKLYDLLCVKQSYRNWQHFKERILDVFCEDVANNEAISYFVKYDPIFAKKYGRGRRSVVSVEFWLVPKPSKIETSKKTRVLQQIDDKDTTVEDNAENIAVFDEKTVSAEVVVDIEVVSKAKELLLKKGVLDSVADQLVEDYPEEFLLEQISDFERRDIMSVKSNPGAFLKTKIENAWKQIGTIKTGKKEAFTKKMEYLFGDAPDVASEVTDVVLEAESKAAEAELKAKEDKEKAIDDIVASMTDEQKADIVEKAKEKANEFQRKMLENKTFDELINGAHSGLIKKIIEEYGVQQSMF